MANYEDFRTWLRRELESRHLSLADLARRSKTTLSHLSRIMSGERVPGVATLVKIATGLGLPADAVLRHAGQAPVARGIIEGQDELVHYFAEMTPVDRRRFLAVARAFLAEREEE